LILREAGGLFGTLEARRRAVISRLREYGPPTIPMIQSVLAPLFDYSDPADVVVLECDRAALRTAHTYTGVLTSASTAISCVYSSVFSMTGGCQQVVCSLTLL